MKISIFTKPVLNRYVEYMLDNLLESIFKSFNRIMKKEYKEFKKNNSKEQYIPSTGVVDSIIDTLKEATQKQRYPDVLTLKMSNTNMYLNRQKNIYEYVTFSKSNKKDIIQTINNYLFFILEQILILASIVVRITKRNMITDRTLDVIGSDKNINALKRDGHEKKVEEDDEEKVEEDNEENDEKDEEKDDENDEENEETKKKAKDEVVLNVDVNKIRKQIELRKRSRKSS